MKLWEVFVFPSRFWLSKLCMHCNNKFRFNFKSIFLILVFLIVGIVLGNIIVMVFSIDSTVFEAIFLIFFVSIPLLLGKKLFIKRNNKQQKMNGCGNGFG